MLIRFVPVSKTVHNSKSYIWIHIIKIKLPPWGGAYINAIIMSNEYTWFYIKPREDQGKRVNSLYRPLILKIIPPKLLLLVAIFPDISSRFSFSFPESRLGCPGIAREASSEELGTMSKSNLRGITMGIQPIWGNHSYFDLLLTKHTKSNT